MAYTYEYPRPAVTADCIVITREAEPKVLLIQRGNPVDVSKRHPLMRQLDPLRDAELIGKYSDSRWVLGWKPDEQKPRVLISTDIGDDYDK